jgi:hypothetical protein
MFGLDFGGGVFGRTMPIVGGGWPPANDIPREVATSTYKKQMRANRQVLF